MTHLLMPLAAEKKPNFLWGEINQIFSSACAYSCVQGIVYLTPTILGYALPTSNVALVASLGATVFHNIIIVIINKTVDYLKNDNLRNFKINYENEIILVTGALSHLSVAALCSIPSPMSVPTICMLAGITLGTKLVANKATDYYRRLFKN